MDFTFMLSVVPELLSGVPLTARLVTLSLAAGFVLAVGLASLRLSSSPVLSRFAAAYVYVFRGTPLLVQIFIIYYGSGQFRGFFQDIGLWGILREPFWCAIIALTLNTTAYTSEIIRGGIESVPFGQIEAARAVGMSRWLQFRRIIFPVAIRQALPAYGNEVILMVKSTSLASIITLWEVTGLAKKIIAETYMVMETFIVAGAIYLAINFVLTRAIKALEYRLSPHLREAPEAAAPVAVEVAAIGR